MEINTPSPALAPDGVVPDRGADAGLKENPVASVVLHAVAFDECARIGVGVVPDAVAEVVMDEVVAERHVRRLPHLLFRAVIGDLVAVEGRVIGRTLGSRHPARRDSTTRDCPRCGGCNCS